MEILKTEPLVLQGPDTNEKSLGRVDHQHSPNAQWTFGPTSQAVLRDLRSNRLFRCLLRKIKPVILPAMIITYLSACTKDAIVKLPKVEPKLVISSFISPTDSLVKVSVALSQPLYGNASSRQYMVVTNANVLISSTLGSYVLKYDPNLQSYVADSIYVKIKEGLNYNLLVSTPDGKVASATTSIPEKNNSLNFTLSQNQPQLAYSVKATWLDPVSTTDYYRLLLQSPAFFLTSGQDQNGNGFSDTVKVIRAESVFIRDSDNSGGILSTTMSFTLSNNSDNNVSISLLHVSKEYMDYEEKFLIASESGPFREPVQMYTNITNGLGVFAGYNKYRIKILP